MKVTPFRQSVRDLGARVAGAVWAAFGGVVGVLIALLTSDWINEYRWFAAPAGVCTGLMWAYHEVILDRDRAILERDQERAAALAVKNELKEFKDALPNIEFVETKAATVDTGAGKSFVIQARFKNRPKVRAPGTVARSVSALIEFWSAKGEQSLNGPYHGAWARAAAPGHVGWTDLLETVDFEANDIPQKLYIALQPEGTSEAYVFCKENLHAYANGAHPSYKLIFGTYLVRVTLRSAALEQDFCFRLDIGATGRPFFELEPYEPMGELKRVMAGSELATETAAASVG